MAARIGIYSGTFDPVHAGHIAFATATASQLELDEIVLLPEERPRSKQNVTAISHRTALLEKATETIPQLHVLRLESPQFSVQETLPELRVHFPRAQLVLLVGSDVVRSLLRWPSIALLLREMPLAIGIREDSDAQEITATLQAASLPVRFTLIETDHSHLTSSQVRRGEAGFYNSAAAEYAHTHSLYPANQ